MVASNEKKSKSDLERTRNLFSFTSACTQKMSSLREINLDLFISVSTALNVVFTTFSTRPNHKHHKTFYITPEDESFKIL